MTTTYIISKVRGSCLEDPKKPLPSLAPTLSGVANPFHVANIQTGESVLDLGSGLGIDSFLAMKYCGADNDEYISSSADNGLVAPSVLGVDLAGNVRITELLRT